MSREIDLNKLADNVHHLTNHVHNQTCALDNIRGELDKLTERVLDLTASYNDLHNELITILKNGEEL